MTLPYINLYSCSKKSHFLTIFETSRCQDCLFNLEHIQESRGFLMFAFTQSPYFSLWVSKSNLDGFKTPSFDSAQKPEHALDFTDRGFLT